MPSKRDVLGLLCRADLIKFTEHCDPDTLRSVIIMYSDNTQSSRTVAGCLHTGGPIPALLRPTPWWIED